MTGRLASQTGYGKSHPLLLDFNPTLASVLKGAGYETAATVDNPNVAASLGYAKGFDRYRETWEEKALASEMDRTRAITADGVRYLAEAKPDRPFFLWLHYVNPHAPYEPPAPVGHRLPRRRGVARPAAPAGGRVPRRGPEAVGGAGEGPLGWYVAQYDGEIAAVDAEVGSSWRPSTPRRCGTAPWSWSPRTTARAWGSTATTSTTARTSSTRRCGSR